MGAGDGRALRPRPRRRRCAADRRFRRAVPAGGVRQLPGAARDARREPVRRARKALARLRGDRGRRARHSGWARPAQALRQHGAVALPRRTGPALDAALGGRPHQEHAARPHRSGGDGAVRAGAGDDHPSRIFVARAAARRGRGYPRGASQRLRPRREPPRAGPRHLRNPPDRALRHPHRRLQHEAGGPDKASPIGALRDRRAGLRRCLGDAPSGCAASALVLPVRPDPRRPALLRLRIRDARTCSRG